MYFALFTRNRKYTLSKSVCVCVFESGWGGPGQLFIIPIIYDNNFGNVT